MTSGTTVAKTIWSSLLRPLPPELFVEPVLGSPPEPDEVVVLEVLAGVVVEEGGEDEDRVVEGDGEGEEEVVKVGGEDEEDVVEGDGEDKEDVVEGGGDDEESEEQVDCPPSPFDMI